MVTRVAADGRVSMQMQAADVELNIIMIWHLSVDVSLMIPKLGVGGAREAANI